MTIDETKIKGTCTGEDDCNDCPSAFDCHHYQPRFWEYDPREDCDSELSGPYTDTDQF